MSNFWGDYAERLTVNGDSNRERIIKNSQESFKSRVINSPGYKVNAMRNNISQPLVIEPTKKSYKSKIIALPEDSLFVGDLIYNDGEYWLVVETKITNPIQVSGIGWLCNQLFRFQNSTSDIIERWGVLDSGSYSKTNDDQIQEIDDKNQIYLPYDEDTKKLYVDKRLATNISYNNKGEEILTAYKIINTDPISMSYGQGGHLLVLGIDSSDYQEGKDNIEELICDYIPLSGSGEDPSTTLLLCSISGRSTLRTGTAYTFSVEFYKADGVTIDDSIESVWSISPDIDGITSVSNGNSIRISIPDEDVRLFDTYTNYEVITQTIEHERIVQEYNLPLINDNLIVAAVEAPSEKYKGYKDICLSSEDMGSFYSNLNCNYLNLLLNEYVIIRNVNGDIVELRKWDGETNKIIQYKQLSNDYIGKVNPKNIQQKLAFDMLQNLDIPVKVLSGLQGSGKDYLMLSHALDLVLKKHKYDKIVWVNFGSRM